MTTFLLGLGVGTCFGLALAAAYVFFSLFNNVR